MPDEKTVIRSALVLSEEEAASTDRTLNEYLALCPLPGNGVSSPRGGMPLREDLPSSSLPEGAVLCRAPAVSRGLILTPRAFEEENA